MSGNAGALPGDGALPLPAARALLRLLTREPVMLAGVVLAFVLAAISASVLLIHGDLIGAEGHVQKAMTFNFAVGLYLATLTVLLPLARMSPRLHRGWIIANALILPAFLGIENVQVYRGIDPRFTEVGSATDEAIGALFGLTALVVIALFIVVVVRFFRRPVDQPDHLLLLGARYGALAVLAAFVVGVGMSVLSGSTAGDEGNLLPAHAVGFHGLQAVPFVAWLVLPVANRGGETHVHLAGLAWVMATLALCAQAALGRDPLALTPANIVAAIGLLAWAVVAADALRHRRMLPAAPAGGMA